MKKIRVLLLGLILAGSLAPVASARAFCDESEGCSPCPPPHVVIDGKNTRIEWVYC